MHSEFLPIIY